MTATILLIRHAAHAHLGTILSGRTPGISLSREGESQAARLARQLEGVAIHLLQTSPVQRARETAAAIAASHPGLVAESVPALDEVDFGEWSGRAFIELAADPQWGTWNRDRANATAPRGESMAQAQQRAWSHVEAVALAQSGRTIAMISHCDIIRAVVARVLGLTMDAVLRFDIDPASVSRLAVGAWGAKVLSLNERCP
ncbi:MAG: histidine phosphatase family protein [Novosphingobium sp.]|nr:histidine phosphatase family protein [Novosphingobium sp.]